MEVTYVLGGAMLWLGGKASSIEDGMKQCKSAVYSGKAYEKFLQVVERQGGDVSFVENPAKFVHARHTLEVSSNRAGYIAWCDTMKIGLLSIDLGAGRKKVDDVIDPAAGITLKKKMGDRVQMGEVIASIHTNNGDIGQRVASDLAACIHLADEPGARAPLIAAYLDAAGVKPWHTPELY